MKLRFALAGLLALVFLCLAAFSGAARPAQASTTINVNTFTDELNTDGDCSLREAIRAANLDVGVDACPAGSGTDTVILPAGTCTLTLPGTGENSALTGDLDITSHLTISGAGPSSTVVDADQIDRVFHITGALNVTLAIMTMRGGNPGTGSGGGIYNNGGTLTLTDCVVTASTANVNGGGIYNSGGVVNLMRSTISANDGGSTRFSHGGGIYSSGGTVNITESTISGNTVEEAGGGIYNTGVLNITRSAI
ncbi:MAG TPA: CSLREA domain-containing protein, partial [Anaerolineae bacterium]|nr:CSLREA domain-containing protein [Anaerolineae bacterium]